jgi:uncharacterized membrane protein
MALHASDLGDVVPAVLITHIASGGLAVLAGAGALSFRKGERFHRAAGVLFVLSMTVMGLSAAYIAWRIQSVTLPAALFAIYLVATSWLTVRSPNSLAGVWSIAALAFVAGMAGVELWFGWKAFNAPDHKIYGYPAPPYLVTGAVAGLAALFDVKALLSGGVSGPARIARHLWRMCFAFFIALGSFATQGLRHVIPPELKGTPLHWALVLGPALLVLLLMIWWLVRVRFTSFGRRLSEPPRPAEA